MIIPASTGFKLKIIDLSDNTTVTASGGTNTQTLTPPDSKIYEIIGIDYSAADPAGSSSGTHALSIRVTNLFVTAEHLYVRGTTGTGIYIQPNNGLVGDSSEVPSATSDQLFYITRGALKCSATNTIAFIYTNNTDVNQTGNRQCKVMVLEYNEMA